MAETMNITVANPQAMVDKQQELSKQYKLVGSQSVAKSDSLILTFERLPEPEPTQTPITTQPIGQTTLVEQPKESQTTIQPVGQATLIEVPKEQTQTTAQPETITQRVTSYGDVVLQQAYMNERGYELTNKDIKIGNPTAREDSQWIDYITLTFTKTRDTETTYTPGTGTAPGYQDLTNTAAKAAQTIAAPDSGIKIGESTTATSMPNTQMTIEESTKPNLYIQAIDTTTGNKVSLPNPEALKDPSNSYLTTTTDTTGKAITSLVSYNTSTLTKNTEGLYEIRTSLENIDTTKKQLTEQGYKYTDQKILFGYPNQRTLVFQKMETPTIASSNQELNYSPMQEADLLKAGYSPVATSTSGNTIYTKTPEEPKPTYTDTPLNIKAEDTNLNLPKVDLSKSTTEQIEERKQQLLLSGEPQQKYESLSPYEQAAVSLTSGKTLFAGTATTPEEGLAKSTKANIDAIAESMAEQQILGNRAGLDNPIELTKSGIEAFGITTMSAATLGLYKPETTDLTTQKILENPITKLGEVVASNVVAGEAIGYAIGYAAPYAQAYGEGISKTLKTAESEIASKASSIASKSAAPIALAGIGGYSIYQTEVAAAAAPTEAQATEARVLGYTGLVAGLATGASATKAGQEDALENLGKITKQGDIIVRTPTDESMILAKRPDESIALKSNLDVSYTEPATKYMEIAKQEPTTYQGTGKVTGTITQDASISTAPLSANIEFYKVYKNQPADIQGLKISTIESPKIEVILNTPELQGSTRVSDTLTSKDLFESTKATGTTDTTQTIIKGTKEIPEKKISITEGYQVSSPVKSTTKESDTIDITGEVIPSTKEAKSLTFDIDTAKPDLEQLSKESKQFISETYTPKAEPLTEVSQTISIPKDNPIEASASKFTYIDQVSKREVNIPIEPYTSKEQPINIADFETSVKTRQDLSDIIRQTENENIIRRFEETSKPTTSDIITTSGDMKLALKQPEEVLPQKASTIENIKFKMTDIPSKIESQIEMPITRTVESPSIIASAPSQQYDKVYESTGNEFLAVPQMQTVTTQPTNMYPDKTISFPSATNAFPSPTDGYSQLQPAQFNPIDSTPFIMPQASNIETPEKIISFPKDNTIIQPIGGTTIIQQPNTDISQGSSQTNINDIIQNIQPDTSQSNTQLPEVNTITNPIQNTLPNQDISSIQDILPNQAQSQKQDQQQIQDLMQPQKTITQQITMPRELQKFKMPEMISFKLKKTEERTTPTNTPFKMSKIYTRYKTRRKPIMSDPIARAVTRSYGHLPKEPKLTKGVMEQSAFGTPTAQLQKRPTFLYGKSFIVRR